MDLRLRGSNKRISLIFFFLVKSHILSLKYGIWVSQISCRLDSTQQPQPMTNEQQQQWHYCLSYSVLAVPKHGGVIIIIVARQWWKPADAIFFGHLLGLGILGWFVSSGAYPQQWESYCPGRFRFLNFEIIITGYDGSTTGLLFWLVEGVCRSGSTTIGSCVVLAQQQQVLLLESELTTVLGYFGERKVVVALRLRLSSRFWFYTQVLRMFGRNPQVDSDCNEAGTQRFSWWGRDGLATAAYCCNDKCNDRETLHKIRRTNRDQRATIKFL